MPPFPYAAVGRLDDGTTSQVLLSGPGHALALRAGDAVDSQWRIDAVTDEGVRATWLPGQQQQIISYKTP
jgi:hypothetical protein